MNWFNRKTDRVYQLLLQSQEQLKQATTMTHYTIALLERQQNELVALRAEVAEHRARNHQLEALRRLPPEHCHHA